MEEALVEGEMAFIADEETTEVTQVSEGALNPPALAIAAEGASILELDFTAPAMGTDQLDPACGEPCAEALRVIGPITNQALGAGPRTTRAWTRHLDRAQGFFRQGNFRGRGAKESASQRNTRAVCHHHPLRTFATFGFTHAEPPFLALAKLPSINTSLQLSLPPSSSSQRKSRQRVSQTFSSSQSRSLRQQVLALGYALGRSRQRAPLRKTHKMPSRTARSLARGRPKPRAGGNRGWIFSHCRSLKSEVSRIPSFPHHRAHSYKHKMLGPQINSLSPPLSLLKPVLGAM